VSILGFGRVGGTCIISLGGWFAWGKVVGRRYLLSDDGWRCSDLDLGCEHEHLECDDLAELIQGSGSRDKLLLFQD
jgi:hypothetical protein